MLGSLPLKIKKVIRYDHRTNAPQPAQNGAPHASATENFKTQEVTLGRAAVDN